ncbi:hypothetical protein RMSM_04789 [Rhodopirellula maiorica SM1]|uniref:Uncharacterized protein n=1 Tax=Rhodopirellula maiorica SM1 TaxID=1265738 RepID=M5RGL9_9BACT|nr:hypothetical protein RMSM_04789 [Rhodopirellula maiorica SM1]
MPSAATPHRDVQRHNVYYRHYFDRSFSIPLSPNRGFALPRHISQ